MLVDLTDNQADWNVGQHYSQIDLPTSISGRVDVWNQSPDYFQGNEPFDMVIGI